MDYRSSVLIGLLAVCVFQQVEASCLRKGKIRSCGKTSVSSAADYHHDSFNDFVYDKYRHPVEVIHYGQPCHRMKALPYSVELPKKHPEPPRGFEYGYSVEAMHHPKEGPRGFTFDYQVEVPKSPPHTTLHSYNYQMEVPHHAPEKPRGFTFDYAVEVPKPKVPVKTYEYSYHVNHPPPKHHEIVGKSFDCHLEVPHRPPPEKKLEGLVAQVDKVLLPHSYKCPPEVEDHTDSSELYHTGHKGESCSCTQNHHVAYSDGSYGYGTSEEESANALDHGYTFGEASYESVQLPPHKARYANHRVNRRSCSCYPYGYGYSIMPFHGRDFYTRPAPADNGAFQPYLEKQSEHNDHHYYYNNAAQLSPSYLRYPLPGLVNSPNSEIYPYDHTPYYIQSPKLGKRESVVAHNLVPRSLINVDDTTYQTSNVVDPMMHSLTSQGLDMTNPEVANGLSNQIHMFVPNVASRRRDEDLHMIPHLYHNAYMVPNVSSSVAHFSANLQENDFNLDAQSALTKYNSSINATKEQESNVFSEGREFHIVDNFSPKYEEGKSSQILSSIMHAYPSTTTNPYLTVMNPVSTGSNNQTSEGSTNLREGRNMNHTIDSYLHNPTETTNFNSSHQQREAVLEFSGIPSMNYQPPKKYVILSEDGSVYDFLTSEEVDESAESEDNGNSIETTISQHYLKSHENGYFIPNIGMGDHWKFTRPVIVNKKKFLPSWLQEPKPDLDSYNGFRILKEKVLTGNSGIRRFYEEEPLHRISDTSLEQDSAPEDNDEEAYNSNENSDSNFDYGYPYGSLWTGNENYANRENEYVNVLSPSFNEIWNHRPVRKVLTFPKPSRKPNKKVGKNSIYRKLNSSPRLPERLKNRKLFTNLLRQKTANRFNLINRPNSIICHDASKLINDNLRVPIGERVTHPIVGLNSAWYCRGLYPYRGNDVHRLDCSTKSKQDNKDDYSQINCLDRNEDHATMETANQVEHLKQEAEKMEIVVSEHNGLLQSVQYPQESAIHHHTDKLSILETDLAANQAALEVDIINNGRVGIDLKTIMHPTQSVSTLDKHDHRKYEELHDSGKKKELFQFLINKSSPLETFEISTGTGETLPHVKKTLEQNSLHAHKSQHSHDFHSPCDCEENHNNHFSHAQHKCSKVTDVLNDSNKNNLVELKIHTDVGKPIYHHVANHYYPVLAHHSHTNKGQTVHKTNVPSNIVHPYFHHSSFPTKYYILQRPPHALHYGHFGEGTAEFEVANKVNKEIGPQKDIVEVHLSSHESNKLNSQGSENFDAQNSLTSEAIIDRVGNILTEYTGNKFSPTPNTYLHTGENHIIVSETQQENHGSGPVTSSFSLDLHHQHADVLPSEKEEVKVSVMKDNNEDDSKNQHTELEIIQRPIIETDLTIPNTGIEVHYEKASSVPQHEITPICEDTKVESDTLSKDNIADKTVLNVIQHTDTDGVEDKFHSISVLKENEPISHIHILDNGIKESGISLNSKNNRFENAAYEVISHGGHAADSGGDKIEIHIINKSGEQSEVAEHCADTIADGHSETAILKEQNNEVDEKRTDNEATIINDKLFEVTHLSHPHISVAQNHVDRIYSKYPKLEHYGTYPSQQVDHINNKFVGYKKFSPINNKGYYLNNLVHRGIPNYDNVGNSLNHKAHFDLHRKQQNIALNKGLVIPYGGSHYPYYHRRHPILSGHKELAGKVDSNIAYYKTHPHLLFLRENTNAPEISVEVQKKLNSTVAVSNLANKDAHHLSSYLRTGEKVGASQTAKGIASVHAASQERTEISSGKELEADILKNNEGEITVKTEVNHPLHSHKLDAAHVHTDVLKIQPSTGIDHHLHSHIKHHYPEGFRTQHFHMSEVSKINNNDNSNNGGSVDRELHSDNLQSKIEQAMGEESIRYRTNQPHIPYDNDYYHRYTYMPQQETFYITKQAITSGDLKQHGVQDNINGFRSAEIKPEDRGSHEGNVTATIPGQLKESFVEHSGTVSTVDSVGNAVQNQGLAETTNTEKAINSNAAYRSSVHFEASPNSDTPLREITLTGIGGTPQLTMTSETILGANNNQLSKINDHEGSISILQSIGGEKHNYAEAVQRQQHLEIMKQLQEEYQQKYGMQHEQQQVVQTVESKPLQLHQTLLQLPHHEISESTKMSDKNMYELQEGGKTVSVLNRFPATENKQQLQEFQQQHFQEATKEYSNMKDYYSMQELLNKNHQQNTAMTVLNNLQGQQNLHNLQTNLDKVYLLSNKHKEHEQLSNAQEALHINKVTHVENLQEQLNKEQKLEEFHHKELTQGTKTVHETQAMQNEQKLHEQVSSYDNSQQVEISKINPGVSQFHESSKLYNVHDEKFFSQQHKEELKTFKDESKSNIMSLGTVTHVKPWHHEIPINRVAPGGPMHIIRHHPLHPLPHAYQHHQHHQHHHHLHHPVKHTHVPVHSFRSVETQIPRPETKSEVRSV